MYCMIDVCFLCLCTYKEPKDFVEKKISDETSTKEIINVLPELDNLDLDKEVPLRICSTCSTWLHSFYQFKQVSLRNISQWNKYKNILRDAAVSANNQCFDYLYNKISANKQQRSDSYVQVKEEVDDTTIYLKSDVVEQSDVEYDIEIKEEVLSDANEDTEYYESMVNNFEYNDNEIIMYQTEDINMFKGFDKNDLECSICNKISSFKKHLHKHTVSNTNLKRIECPICKKKFKSKRYLNKHTKLHSGIKKFECSICDKKFARKAHLNAHMLIHTGLKEFQCSICNKKFARKFTLAMHMVVHTGVKNYECLVCNKKFAYKSDLKKHTFVHTGEKKFECSICKKKFKQAGHLKTHMNTCIVGKTEPISKIIKCYICYKTFNRKSHLTNHMAVHTGFKRFECLVCNKKFTRSDNLKTHTKIHFRN